MANNILLRLAGTFFLARLAAGTDDRSLLTASSGPFLSSGAGWSSTTSADTDSIFLSFFGSFFDDDVTAFKNPFEHPKYCHVEDKGSRICDPDGVLEARDRRALDYDVNWAMTAPGRPEDHEEDHREDDEHAKDKSARPSGSSDTNPSLPPSEDQESERQTNPTTYVHPNCSLPGVEIGIAIREQTDDPPEAVCRSIFDAWGVGDPHCNNGVLIYLATSAHQIYICTGPGAKGSPNFLTNPKLQAMIDDIKRDFLRDGDYFGGLQALLVKIRTTIFHETGPGLVDYASIVLVIHFFSTGIA